MPHTGINPNKGTKARIVKIFKFGIIFTKT